MVKHPVEGHYYVCNEATLGIGSYPCIIQMNSQYYDETIVSIGIKAICMFYKEGRNADLKGCYSTKNNLQELSLPLLLQYRIEEFPKAFKEFLKDYLKSAIHNSE